MPLSIDRTHLQTRTIPASAQTHLIQNKNKMYSIGGSCVNTDDINNFGCAII